MELQTPQAPNLIFPGLANKSPVKDFATWTISRCRKATKDCKDCEPLKAVGGAAVDILGMMMHELSMDDP